MKNNISGVRQSILKSSSVSSECGLLETTLAAQRYWGTFFLVACHIVDTIVFGQLDFSSSFLFSFAVRGSDVSSWT